MIGTYQLVNMAIGGKAAAAAAGPSSLVFLFGSSLAPIVASCAVTSLLTSSSTYMLYNCFKKLNLTGEKPLTDIMLEPTFSESVVEKYGKIMERAENLMRGVEPSALTVLVVLAVISGVFAAATALAYTVLYSASRIAYATSKVLEKMGFDSVINHPEDEDAGLKRTDTADEDEEYYNVSINDVGKYQNIFNISSSILLKVAVISSSLGLMSFFFLWGGAVFLGKILPEQAGESVKPLLQVLKVYALMAMDAVGSSPSGKRLPVALVKGFIDWLVTVGFAMKVCFSNVEYVISTVISFIIILGIVPTFYSLARINRSEQTQTLSTYAILAVKALFALFLGVITLLVLLYPLRVATLVFPVARKALLQGLSIIAGSANNTLSKMENFSGISA
ncbi:uncharacterized protein NEMAJ01_2239 [Nematocida major]|uniref:uncharacterized protein n=1 Tax=Nematocida major TaxID=1912982 RepID=UPI0020071F48|nr:uncharacterized protein NEMAJ01_2239 [Nematocida major]KAH9387343.1 hypothetical protein NEMAJ01_2239 [Nematocida major]